MDLGSIFFILALALLVALYIARPLLNRNAVGVTEEEQTLSTWLARRDRVLDALQELDFDYKLGKIPEADYPQSRAFLLQQGADILKKLDTLQPHHNGKNHDSLEEVIATRREQTAAQQESAPRPRVANPDDDIETLLAARRRERKTKSAGFCTQCGHPIQTVDKFCSKCGTKVSEK